jgi:hypothetical protein
MAYDWRPSATRSATTDPNLVVPGAGAQGEDISMAAAIDQFIEAAENGQAVNRSGRTYRPSALRDLSGILRYHVAPELGDTPLRAVGRRHVQGLVDRLAEEELSESRIRSVISALRGLYGYAIEHGYAEFNPADGLVMPRRDGASASEDPPDEESRRPNLVDRLDEAWAERPRWEDRPRRDDRPRPDDLPRQDDPPPRREDPRKVSKGPDRGAYQPIAVLPERLLSFALRLAFVLLIVVAIISLLQPA